MAERAVIVTVKVIPERKVTVGPRDREAMHRELNKHLPDSVFQFMKKRK